MIADAARERAVLVHVRRVRLAVPFERPSVAGWLLVVADGEEEGEELVQHCAERSIRMRRRDSACAHGGRLGSGAVLRRSEHLSYFSNSQSTTTARLGPIRLLLLEAATSSSWSTRV